jgi:ribosomal protein S18 acetylase RimI-like enzyme
MINNMNSPVMYKRIETQEEIDFCAKLRASLDPWITLQRDYNAAVKSLTASDHEVYLAIIEHEIAGFAVLSMLGALTGFILTLCVVPKFQGRSIGSKLLAYCENRIFQETPNIFLLVSSFNTKAQTFYLRHGYQKIGELNDYVIAGYSEYLMRKTISPRNDFYQSKPNL